MDRRLCLTAATVLMLAACGDAQQVATTEEPADTGTVDLGQSEPVQAAREAVSGAVSGTTGATLGAQTAEAYVSNAALSDMYEIQSSRLALEKSPSPQVRTFAQQMIKDHTATTNQLKEIMAETDLTVQMPTTLDARRRSMLDSLRAASPGEFDTIYMDQQMTAHNEALSLHRSYAENGDNQRLRQFAAKTAPIIERHIETARNMTQAGTVGATMPETSGETMPEASEQRVP